MPVTVQVEAIELQNSQGEKRVVNMMADQTTARLVQELTESAERQKQQIQDKGDEVLSSIPEEYKELNKELDDVKESLFNTIEDLGLKVIEPKYEVIDWWPMSTISAWTIRMGIPANKDFRIKLDAIPSSAFTKYAVDFVGENDSVLKEVVFTDADWHTITNLDQECDSVRIMLYRKSSARENYIFHYGPVPATETNGINIKAEIEQLSKDLSQASESIVDVSDEANELFHKRTVSVNGASTVWFYFRTITGKKYKIHCGISGMSAFTSEGKNRADIETISNWIPPNTAIEWTATSDANYIKFYFVGQSTATISCDAMIDEVIADVNSNVGKIANLEKENADVIPYVDVHNMLTDVTFADGKYIAKNSGIVKDLNGFKATEEYIPIGIFKKLCVKRTFHYGGDGLAFYSKEKLYISGYGDTTEGFVVIDVPNGAEYFRLSCFREETPIVYGADIDKSVTNAISSGISKIKDVKITNRILSDIFGATRKETAITIDKENGIIIHDRSTGTSGNGWFDMPVVGFNQSKNSVIFSFDVTEIDGKASVYLFGKSPDNSHCWINLGTIDKVGRYSYTVDLNYYVVYRNLDITKEMSFGISNATNPFYAKYETLFVFDDETKLDTSKSLGENLNTMVSDISQNANDIARLEAETSKELVSPNGSRFLMQVSDSGEIVLVPKIPSNILYIGNSLLLGFSTFGMASTRSTEDYYYRVNQYLTDLGKTPTTNRQQGSAYEGCTSASEQDSWLSTTLLPKLNEQEQLVLIQLGDNVNTDAKLAVFEEGAKKLIRYIRTHAPKARVAWVGEWYGTKAKQTCISNACIECGATFVDISDLPNVSGNQNYVGAKYYTDDGVEHEITNSGVASHPSSQGMKQVADRIIEKLFK